MLDAQPGPKRSAEEGQMRELVAARLREFRPEARIIHELPLRYSSNRLDMASVGAESIIGVEIKSSRDVTTRLEAQLRAFAPICTKLIVALAPKWNAKLPDIITETKSGGTLRQRQHTEAQQIIRSIGAYHIETWTVDAAAGAIEITDRAIQQQPGIWPAKLLDILHVAELQAAAIDARNGFHGSTHSHGLQACLSAMTTPQALRAACRALRARKAFCPGTDPPIPWEAPHA